MVCVALGAHDEISGQFWRFGCLTGRDALSSEMVNHYYIM